jgi:cell division protein ZapA
VTAQFVLAVDSRPRSVEESGYRAPCATIQGTRHEEPLMSSPVKVQIFGQTYTIQGELDPAYVQKLATFVDDKMRAIADAAATVDTHKIAVLAALAIADELHSTQRDLGEHNEMLREQAERCITLVERALKQTA